MTGTAKTARRLETARGDSASVQTGNKVAALGEGLTREVDRRG